MASRRMWVVQASRWMNRIMRKLPVPPLSFLPPPALQQAGRFQVVHVHGLVYPCIISVRCNMYLWQSQRGRLTAGSSWACRRSIRLHGSQIGRGPIQHHFFPTTQHRTHTHHTTPPHGSGKGPATSGRSRGPSLTGGACSSLSYKQLFDIT